MDKNTLNVKYEKVTESGAADISASEITEVGTYKVTYSVPDTNDEFTGSVTYTFTVEPKSINDAVVTLGESHKYNGSEQTQTVASVKIGDMTLSARDYDISDNKAADVKADGNYVLTITGKGNFSGTKTAEWNIMPTEPTESADKKTTARVRRSRTLSDADVTYGELLAVDGTTVLDGTFLWNDGTKVINEDGTEQMTFTPTSKNYLPITVNVAVSAYSADGGSSSSSSSSATVYTVKFNTNGGSDIENQTVKKNAKVSEPTAPTKDGYKFGGWFTDKNLKNKYNFASKVTESFTLYAAWSEVKTDTDSNPTDKPENPEKGDSEKDNLFDDVKKDDRYYDDVINAVAKGLFNGTENKTFAPNDIITRAMFVTVLYRAEGEPEVNAAVPFADVEAGGYYANAVIWATQNGIVKGVSETEFAPNENITREQIAAIMFRCAEYKGYDVSQGGMQIREFNDYESISEYAMPAMAWAVNTGLMKGKTENALNPHDSATRAEIAAILNRFIDGNK